MSSSTPYLPFSVLLSTYAHENAGYLGQALKSIFHQTLPPTEVVLVEDGPLPQELHDVIATYQREFPTLRVVASERNQGLGAALNLGLDHCTCELVARMDTDDICAPQRFEKQVAFMAAHQEVDVLSAWIEEFNSKTGEVISMRRLPEDHEAIAAFCKRRNPINHPAVMFRKSKVMAAGGYQPFYLLEDYYLWVRMIAQGARFHNLQEPLLKFRMSHQMFERRGGMAYVRSEIRFQKALHNMHLISFWRMAANIFLRTAVRLVPNKIRRAVYMSLLR